MAYVYHIVVDNVVRYVGKGNGARVYKHMQRVRAYVRRKLKGVEVTELSDFHFRLKNAWLRDRVIEERIVYKNLSDKDAYRIEAVEIEKYRKFLWFKGRISIGGTVLGSSCGPKGCVWNEERRKQHSANTKIAWADPEIRARIQKSRKSHYERLYANSLTKKIVDLLSNKPGLMPREIMHELSLSESQVRNRLQECLKDKRLFRHIESHKNVRYFVVSKKGCA